MYCVGSVLIRFHLRAVGRWRAQTRPLRWVWQQPSIVRGLHRNQPARQQEEKGRSRLRNGIAYGRPCHLLPKWALWVGGYLKPSAASLNPSLGGPGEILLCIYFYILGKGKLQQYVRRTTGYCGGTLVSVITYKLCAVPAGELEPRCPCERKIKLLANNRKIVTLGKWSWRPSLSNFTYFHYCILYSLCM